MRKDIYIRIGKNKEGKVKVNASLSPDKRPLQIGTTYIPTILVKLDLTVDDSAFKEADIQLKAVAQLAEPCIDLKVE